MRHYCTYFDANYLDRGLALHESMQAHCTPFHLWVLALCERAEARLKELALPDVTVVGLGEFETDELRAARGDRARHEWIWTCTPFWMLWVFEEAEVKHLSYLDADMYWFASPDPLAWELFDVEVAITPHRFSPSRRWMAKTAGLYNVGLVFVRRTWAGLTCLQDWGKLVLARCVQHEGADQWYWDELLPQYEGHAIQHKGADLAPWNNAGQYQYSLRNEKVYVDEDELLFYHFHKGLQPGFDIDPFVQRHVYHPYRKALKRARERAGT